MFEDVFWNVPPNMTWLNLLPAYAVNETRIHIGNDSIDVMTKGCFNDFNPIACIRNGVMSVLMLVTGGLCVVKVCKLHLGHHPTLHQYTIFYCAMLETLLCAIHWLLGMYAQLDFVAQYLKLVQFLVVSHFYWMLATRALRKEVLTHRVLVPVFGLAFVYFTIVTVLGCLNVQPTWIECFQAYWLALSSAEFALVQLFMLAAVYITRRLNEISTLDSVRRAQKRDLWSLVVAFELSAFVGLVYDLTIKTLAEEHGGCSGVFLHTQEIYSPIFGLFMMMKFMLPLWAMLFVFHPMEAAPEHDELHPAVSEDSQAYASVFTPQYDTRHRYKPLYHPTSASGDATASDSDVSPSPTTTTPIIGPALRTLSSLATISEEVTSEQADVESNNVDDNDRKPILS